MEISKYSGFLRMVEIINTKANYEDLLYDNKIYVNKSLHKLNDLSVNNIMYYFNKSNHSSKNDILDLCKYFKELIIIEDSLKIN